MKVSANLHDIKTIQAQMRGNTTWLKLAADDGSYFIVFMPYGAAVAMADAWNSFQDEQSTEDAA